MPATMMTLIMLLTVSATPAGDAPPAADVGAAMERGVAFLLRDQNDDGSWGGPQDAVTTWSGPVWSNPETHRAWKVATTGLCCAALLQSSGGADASAAAERGLRFVVDNTDVRRPDVWDTMNNWAYIYGLQGLAAGYGDPRFQDSPLRQRMSQAADDCVANLARFQSLNGGWGYLEFDVPRTRRPQWATSFMTAAAVVAMEEARDAGLAVDEPVVQRAVRLVAHCRLPNGGYSYRVRAVPNLHSEYIDQVKGSLAHIQVCQAALLLAGRDVPLEERHWGLEHFFQHHKFLDIAVLKPVPHETYYYNSGYFYMFGHYYAATIIAGLGAERQSRYWPQLQAHILKMQQADGSMWDYDMHRYDRPYGVAFGLLGLARSLQTPVE